MRHYALLLFILSGSLFISCNNDDDNTKDPLAGAWNLTNVYGGLIPTNIDYNQGDVLWIFNTGNGRLEIQNNIKTTGPEQLYSGLPTGNYNYEINLESNEEVLYIDNERKGVLILEEGTFQIDNGLASDGLLRTYER